MIIMIDIIYNKCPNLSFKISTMYATDVKRICICKAKEKRVYNRTRPWKKVVTS